MLYLQIRKTKPPTFRWWPLIRWAFSLSSLRDKAEAHRLMITVSTECTLHSSRPVAQ